MPHPLPPILGHAQFVSLSSQHPQAAKAGVRIPIVVGGTRDYLILTFHEFEEALHRAGHNQQVCPRPGFFRRLFCWPVFRKN